MTPEELEKQIAYHYQKLGYNISLTPKSYDYGVDIIAVNGNDKIVIQVKMYEKRIVNYKDVMYLYAGVKYYDCNKGIFITNGRLFEDAKKVATKLNIEVVENWEIIYSIPNTETKIEIESKKSSHNKHQGDFGEIWKKYIIPLKGKSLDTVTGKTNIISDVSFDCIKRVSSKGNDSKIDYSIFEQCYYHLIEKGELTRDEINHLYTKRASAIIFAILSKVPFFIVKNYPKATLVYKVAN